MALYKINVDNRRAQSYQSVNIISVFTLYIGVLILQHWYLGVAAWRDIKDYLLATMYIHVSACHPLILCKYIKTYLHESRNDSVI